MFNPNQFEVIEPPYQKITDGGRSLIDPSTHMPLIESLPKIRRGDFKLTDPDSMVVNAMFSVEFAHALGYLEAQEGLAEFNWFREQQSQQPLIANMGNPDLVDSKKYMGTCHIGGKPFDQVLTNQGLDIEFTPRSGDSDTPSLRIESRWAEPGNGGMPMFLSQMVVFKKVYVGGNCNVETQMVYQQVDFEDLLDPLENINPQSLANIRQIRTVRSITIPSSVVDFNDPLPNNTKDTTLRLIRYPDDPNKGYFELLCTDYVGGEIPLTEYSVAKNKQRLITVVNKEGNIKPPWFEPNYSPDFYVRWIANNLVFLLGNVLTHKQLVDVT